MLEDRVGMLGLTACFASPECLRRIVHGRESKWENGMDRGGDGGARGEVKGGNNIFFQRAPMAPASGKTTQKPSSHRTSGISDCAIRRSVRHRSLLASL